MGYWDIGLLGLLFFLFILFFLCLASASFAQDKITYDEQGKRDPFIALVTPDGRLLNLEPTGSNAKIVVKGIIYDGSGRCYALINEEVVSIGDFILGYTVFKIEENKVILLKDNKPVEYILEKEEP